MAAATDKAKELKKEKKERVEGGKYPYPSPFGSHFSMIDEELTEELNDDTMVVCRDDYGVYITERKRLDDGMADSNRNAFSRFKHLKNTEKE